MLIDKSPLPGNAGLFSIKMLRKYARCLCKVSSGLEAEREFTGGIYTDCLVFISGLAGWGIYTLKRPSRALSLLLLLSPVQNLYVSITSSPVAVRGSTNSVSTAVNKYYLLHLQKNLIRFYARRHQPFKTIKRKI